MDADKSHVMQAYCDSEQRLHCMKCQEVLEANDVAMFVRTSPSDAFNTWCPKCTLWIMHHAANDLDVAEELWGVLIV